MKGNQQGWVEDENLSHVSPLRETLPYTVCICWADTALWASVYLSVYSCSQLEAKLGGAQPWKRLCKVQAVLNLCTKLLRDALTCGEMQFWALNRNQSFLVSLPCWIQAFPGTYLLQPRDVTYYCDLSVITLSSLKAEIWLSYTPGHDKADVQ